MIQLLKKLLLTVALLFVLLSFVRVYKVSEISMNFSLVEGDIVIVENFSAGVHIPSFFSYTKGHLISNEKGIKRGDIMAFKHPLDDGLYLKRVVALPGDKLFQKEKNLYLQIVSDKDKTIAFSKQYGLELVYIDGEVWLKNPYAHFYGISHFDEVIGPPELINYPPTVIPDHHFFFMGDFRDNSTDSRFFGPVEYGNIYYKVWFVFKRSQTLEELSSIELF